MSTEIETVKDWLWMLRDAVADATLTEERLDSLRSRAEAARVSNLDGMPHGDGFAADRIGDLVCKIEETEAECSRLWRRVGNLRREREAAVGQIHGHGWPE